MDLIRTQCIRGVVLSGVALALMPAQKLHAEFVLDWNADNASPTFSGTSIIHGGTAIADQTPFVYERVNDSTTFANYYHLIVGDPAQDWAQEVYIQVRGITYQGFGDIRVSSASGGQGLPTGNGSDPLGVVNNNDFTGNGSGDATRIQMREILNSGDLSLDFLKNSYLAKPIISTEINNADIQMQFVIDGSGIAYSDDTTQAPITNTMHISDPDIPEGSADFNMATDSQNSIVTAGKYIFNPPLGIGAVGSYSYAEDSFNIDSIKWADYFDSSQTNPWSYTDNRPP